MRIRILKAFYWKDRDVATTPGQVMNVPEQVGELWLRHGMAMQDKTVDVPETKAVLAVPEPKPLPPDVITPIKRRRKARKKWASQTLHW